MYNHSNSSYLEAYMSDFATKNSIHEEGKYYLACAFLGWVFHGFYRLLDDIEVDDIQERLSECEFQFEETSEWLLDETIEAGLRFIKDNKRVSVHICTAPYESTVIDWFRDIESVSKSEYQDITVQYYYFYYLECEWVVQMLAVFNDFVKSLKVPDLIQSYLNASPDFENLRNWLQDELSSVASNFLEEGQLEASKQDRENLYEQLAQSWRSAVISGASQYCPQENL